MNNSPWKMRRSHGKNGLRSSITTGRPLGSIEFLKVLEAKTGMKLQKQKPGRKPNRYQSN